MKKTPAELQREIDFALATDGKSSEWVDGFKLGEGDAFREIVAFGRKSVEATLDQLKSIARNGSEFALGQLAGCKYVLAPSFSTYEVESGRSASKGMPAVARGKVVKVSVDTSSYRKYRGSEPRGRGSWCFVIGKLEYEYSDDPAVYRTPSGMSYAKARDLAVAEAKRRGASIVGVGP